MTEQLSDIDLIYIAIEEQNKCTTFPKVGVVIAKDGAILSKAFRGEMEGKHAERVAIEKLESKDIIGATLVTTLEPCVEIANDQAIKPCADLIIESGIKNIIIGILDPNGKIYCQGQNRLLDKGINVKFFPAELREEVESKTFKYGDCNIGYGPCAKRWVAVLGSGKNFEIRFSKSDDRAIKFRWCTLQFRFGCVDLVGDNDSIRNAIGINTFEQITDPLVFREPSHFSRMTKGDISIISPPNSSFIILIKLLELTETDIYFQWQVRNK